MVRHHMPKEMIALVIAHRADADRDGRVTAAEWKAGIGALDDDNDGALGAGEMQFRHRSDEAATTLPAPVKQWDDDGDGRLSAGELDAIFAAADEDGNGVLELPQRGHHGFRRHGRR